MKQSCHYGYPDTLYCDQCCHDVAAQVVDRVATYVMDSKIVAVDYRAAVCPICGNTLCERDQSLALANYVSKREAL